MNVAEEMAQIAHVGRETYRERLKRKWLPKILKQIRRRAEDGQTSMDGWPLDDVEAQLLKEHGFRISFPDRIEW